MRGVAGLPDLESDLISAATGRPHDLVVISGAEATGKTRLLELMVAVLEVLGPYEGIVRASDWYADATRGARVELELWLDDAPGTTGGGPAATAHAVVDFTASGVSFGIDRAVARQLARYDHDPAHGKREYFPEDRQRSWGARTDGLSVIEQSLLRSSKDPQKYSFVPRFLAELRSDATRSKAFARGLELLSPTVRFTGAQRLGDPTACFTNASRSGIAYDALSSSESDAVLIAATAALIGLNHSIVFLDRPELHVSADRIGAWVQSLARLGVDNQWFVATSEERLAAAVDRTQTISLGPSTLAS
ncbi:MAG TPA: hypothetical protein VL400_11800 [Polyangiaceae bacterium]|nr:hypothetical protein [Polyangiaceae bacterium]